MKVATGPEATPERSKQLSNALSSEVDTRRRFVRAALAGVCVATPAYLSVLWGGGIDPFRTYYADHSFANFYETQARALFHGHWYVPSGSLGIEGFVNHGREYTYFGPLPSLLRMPLLLVTSRLDGRLTAPSMLLAWLVTGLCFSLLLWKLRLLVRGDTPLGVGEATAYGALIATVLSGSVFIYLASTPLVYEEDVAWGVATTLAALLALLMVLERPTSRRVLVAGVAILAANLARTPLGWACVIGAILASGWFASGRGGPANRRWWLPVLASGAVPLLVNMYVTWAKFGEPIGLPFASQVWTQIDQHRRDYLAANGGRSFRLAFVPTDFITYFRLDGIRLTRVYPYITLPAGPPRIFGKAVFDHTYRTASVTASMPLLSILTIWGVISTFFQRKVARPVLWILLVAAGAGVSAVLAVGYIANRYLADFMPVLCLGSALGIVDLFRHLQRRGKVGGRAVVAGIILLAVAGVTANVAAASTPDDAVAWQGTRVRTYVQRQETISKYTGHPLDANVRRGSSLPSWAPADTLFVLDNCSALYISDGETYHTWIPVDFGPGLREAFQVTIQRPSSQTMTVPLVDLGRTLVATIKLEQLGTQVHAIFDDPLFGTTSPLQSLTPGRSYLVTVDIDTQLHTVTVTIAGRTAIFSPLSSGESEIVTHAGVQNTAASPITVTPSAVPVSSLCKALG